MILDEIPFQRMSKHPPKLHCLALLPKFEQVEFSVVPVYFSLVGLRQREQSFLLIHRRLQNLVNIHQRAKHVINSFHHHIQPRPHHEILHLTKGSCLPSKTHQAAFRSIRLSATPSFPSRVNFKQMIHNFLVYLSAYFLFTFTVEF